MVFSSILMQLNTWFEEMEGATLPYELKELVEATQFEPGSLPLRTKRRTARVQGRAIRRGVVPGQ
jgi:hypothetical protein